MYKSLRAYKRRSANDGSTGGGVRALLARILARSVGECSLIYEGILHCTALTYDI